MKSNERFERLTEIVQSSQSSSPMKTNTNNKSKKKKKNIVYKSTKVSNALGKLFWAPGSHILQKQEEKMNSKSESSTTEGLVIPLPEYIVWNLIFPTKKPTVSLFGAEAHPHDYGQNVVICFKLKQEIISLYKDASFVKEKPNALKLFETYWKHATDPKSTNPIKRRFKLIAKCDDRLFEEAGIGWLVSYNGKPKMLRDTTQCRSLPFESCPCFQAIRKEGLNDGNKVTYEADVFEVTVDVMNWTQPMGLPLTSLWNLSSYLKETKFTLAFTVEGETDEELPERIIGACDFDHLDYSSSVPLDNIIALAQSKPVSTTDNVSSSFDSKTSSPSNRTKCSSSSDSNNSSSPPCEVVKNNIETKSSLSIHKNDNISTSNTNNTIIVGRRKKDTAEVLSASQKTKRFFKSMLKKKKKNVDEDPILSISDTKKIHTPTTTAILNNQHITADNTIMNNTKREKKERKKDLFSSPSQRIIQSALEYARIKRGISEDISALRCMTNVHVNQKQQNSNKRSKRNSSVHSQASVQSHYSSNDYSPTHSSTHRYSFSYFKDCIEGVEYDDES